MYQWPVFLPEFSSLSLASNHTLQDQSFESCPPFHCGNFSSINFPFYRNDGWKDCGLPALGLTCDTDQASLYSGGIVYEIDNISTVSLFILFRPISIYTSLNAGEFHGCTGSFLYYSNTLTNMSHPQKDGENNCQSVVLFVQKSSYERHRDDLPSVLVRDWSFSCHFAEFAAYVRNQGVHDSALGDFVCYCSDGPRPSRCGISSTVGSGIC
ncbi:hypothetical protein AMTRI_Chr13g85090 [Amborella trichopoda]